MTAIPKYFPNYTVDDYQHWEGDWELCDGIPISMSPGPFGIHQRIASRLLVAMQNQLSDQGCRAEAIHELDWIVSDSTVVRPDVIVICGNTPERHLHAAPALIAEVLSESTQERDRTYKRDLYEAEGVGVYLLLDPATETLEAYQQSLRTASRSGWHHESVTDSIRVQVCENCSIELKPSEIFKR